MTRRTTPKPPPLLSQSRSELTAARRLHGKRLLDLVGMAVVHSRLDAERRQAIIALWMPCSSRSRRSALLSASTRSRRCCRTGRQQEC
jgi:hypothetical protein